MATTKQSLGSNTTEFEVEKAKSDALFASIGEATIATDEYGRINKVNDIALELLGRTEADLLGKGYMNVVRGYDLKGAPIDPIERPIMRALQEGKTAFGTILFERKDGTRFPVAVTASPIMLEGKPIGIIEVFRDVTREQQIDRAKTEFVSLASHQLRTPLTAMRWYIELLLRRRMGPLTTEQESSLEEVYHVNLRLIELVGALLSVARIEIGTLTVDPIPSDIAQLARDVTIELRPQIAEKQLLFTEYYDTDLPTMLLDPDLTRIIFQNLLTNAVKYTPQGGSVSLKILRKRQYVLIEVADTGYGVPKGQQRQLFTKLFRADNIRRQDTDGTGLGLYIVQSIVESANGKVWFESEENKGATFYVRLPLKGMNAVAEDVRVTR